MKLLSSIFILSLGTFAWAGNAGIQYFAAHVDAQAIVVEWSTSVEENTAGFRVERANSNDEDFFEVALIQATGSNSFYSFRDTRLASSAGQDPPVPTSEFYRYRLAIIGSDGNISSYSHVISVSRPLSTVRQTWGSIKNMFR